ncbi:MAG TPA: hypothetical protein VKA57_10375 [Solirubrobacteraceae bacterium]|nr:hypothetical protein [Solirubrobacteraceae bacterium]
MAARDELVAVEASPRFVAFELRWSLGSPSRCKRRQGIVGADESKHFQREVVVGMTLMIRRAAQGRILARGHGGRRHSGILAASAALSGGRSTARTPVWEPALCSPHAERKVGRAMGRISQRMRVIKDRLSLWHGGRRANKPERIERRARPRPSA